MTGREKLLLDDREVLGADQFIRLVENETRPVAADLVEAASDEFLDCAVVGVDDRRRALVAVFIAVDVEFARLVDPSLAASEWEVNRC
jgi:hypothetical protein